MLEEEKISKGKEDLSVIETDFVGDQDMQSNENQQDIIELLIGGD